MTPQERASTAEVAEVVTPARCGTCGAICDDDEGCECGVECARPARGGIEPEPAAASLLRQDPPQVAGEDVERVARVQEAIRDEMNASGPWASPRVARAALLAALSARPVRAQGTDDGEVHKECDEVATDLLARAEAAEAERDEYRSAGHNLATEVAALRAVVEAVRAVHEPDGSGVCPECVVYGPCDTVKAIDTTPALSGQPVAQEGEGLAKAWQEGYEACRTTGADYVRNPYRSPEPRDDDWGDPQVPVETGGEGK